MHIKAMFDEALRRKSEVQAELGDLAIEIFEKDPELAKRLKALSGKAGEILKPFTGEE